MCLPLAVVGGALLAAGMGAQYFGQQKADHAMTRTFNREQDRQKAFQAEQNAAFQDSLDSTGGVADPAKQAAAAAHRDGILMAATKSASPAAGGYLPRVTGGNQVVNSHATSAGKTADTHTAGLGAALAALGGMTDLMQQNDINVNRNAQTIDQTAGFARGSRDVLQSELDAAKQKGGTMRMLGGLAQQIGGMMLTGGLGGGLGAGASAAPVEVLGQGSLAPSILARTPSLLQASNLLPRLPQLVV